MNIIGGVFLEVKKKQSETPLECIKREIYEELGYNLIKPTYIGRIFNSEFLIHIFHKKIRKKKFIVKEGRDYNYFIKDKILKKKCKSLKLGKEFFISKSSFKVFKYFMKTK